LVTQLPFLATALVIFGNQNLAQVLGMCVSKRETCAFEAQVISAATNRTTLAPELRTKSAASSKAVAPHDKSVITVLHFIKYS
jgi:hypothetical protein